MKSIGNDIVALSETNKQRTADTRFHSKFITPPELALYQAITPGKLPFESFVWLLWAVKEAAYKYQKRIDEQLIFAPGKIVVHNIVFPFADGLAENDNYQGDLSRQKLITGTVLIQNNTLYFKAIVTAEIIASFVNDNAGFNNVLFGIHSIADKAYQLQFAKVRQFCANSLSTHYPHSNLTFAKSPVGYPILFNNSEQNNMLISFAHHGSFVAYCFVLGN